jgi:acyl-coenzyme A synthetase/AMP-(fatty) acid ligase
MNVNNVIWRNSHAHPERIALLCDGQTVTYSALRYTISLVSARLAATGISRGDCVAIAVQSPIAYLSVALAAARIGAVATPLHRGRPVPQKEELVARHAVHTLVHDADDAWRSEAQPALRYVFAGDLFVPPPAEGIPRAVVANDVDDAPWMIALSSGTTGMPKSIPQEHQRAALQFSLLNSLSGSETLAQRVLIFIGINSCVGMNNVMLQLYAGRTAVLTEWTTPENFFRVLHRDKPDQVLMSATTAYKVVAYAAKAFPDRAQAGTSLRSVALVGSIVPPALRALIAQHLCPSILASYGATEIGRLAILAPDDGSPPAGCVGRLHSWVQAQAVDEHDQPLMAGRQGVLRFKAPTMSDGYLNDAQATARSFHDGWFYPGDIGSIDTAGFLTLAGRTDNLLNVGGNKIDPYQVEAVLNSHPAILESVLVAVPNAAGLSVPVAVVVTTGAYDEAELKSLCREQLGREYVPAAIASLPALPRNTGGKVMRRQLAAMIRLSPAGKKPDEGT